MAISTVASLAVSMVAPLSVATVARMVVEEKGEADDTWFSQFTTQEKVNLFFNN